MEEKDLWHHLWAILILAALGGGIALGLWQFATRTPRRLLPLPREPRTGWSGQEVLLVFLFMLLTVPAVTSLFESLGVYTALYDAPPSDYRKQLWAWVLATPLMVASVFLALYALSRTRPPRYGMTPVRWAPNIVAGYLTWLAFAPFVIAVHIAALLGMSPEQLVQERHPIEKLARGPESVMPVEWVLLIFMALVAAPLTEELAFRGILLGWLRRAPLRRHVIIAAVGLLCAVLLPRMSEEQQADTVRWPPVIFAAVLIPAYLIPVLLWEHARREGRLPREQSSLWNPSRKIETAIRPLETGVQAGTPEAGVQDAEDRTQLAPGPPPLPSPLLEIREFFLRTPLRQRVLTAWGPVVGSSYLFSLLHSSVWPSPIPLFLLGLGLGWLAYRTRSLVGPFVMHALFNGVAGLVLALGLL